MVGTYRKMSHKLNESNRKELGKVNVYTVTKNVKING
jgi:hypothetical protein